MTFLLTNCMKEEFDMDKLSTSTTWKPDIALPLIYSSLTLEDILGQYNHTVEEDNNHLCYIIYNNAISLPTAEEMIVIPNQDLNISTNINISGGNLGSGDNYTTTYNSEYVFNFPYNQEIDSIILKNANLSFNIFSNLNYDASVIITLPSLVKNGVAFSETLNLNVGSNNFFNFDLSYYTMKFEVGVLAEPNTIPVTHTIIVHGNGNPNYSPYNIHFDVSFANILFHKIFGYLGHLPYNTYADTVKVKLYDNVLSGHVDFEDPRIYLTTYSSLGIPFSFYTNDFLGKPTYSSPIFVNMTGSGIPTMSNPYLVPSVSFNDIGDWATEIILLNRNNSSIYNVMNLPPRYIMCTPNIIANPAGKTNNFAIDTSRFIFDLKVELPMYGKAWGFVVQDTIDFEFEEIDQLESLQLNIDITNKFPVDGTLQIFFVDSLYNVLDSLISPSQATFYAATPGAAPNYFVTQPTNKFTTATLTGDKLKKLKNMQYFLIRAYLSTYNQGGEIVKIYSFYTLDVKISARAKFKVNL